MFSDLFGEKYDETRGHSLSVFILESELSDLYPRSIDKDGEKDDETSVSYAESSSNKIRRADLKCSETFTVSLHPILEFLLNSEDCSSSLEYEEN